MGRRARCGRGTRGVNVGQDNVPEGKTWYWVGANQPGRDLIELEKPPDAGRPAQGAGRGLRSNMASTTERRWACSLARC